MSEIDQRALSPCRIVFCKSQARRPKVAYDRYRSEERRHGKQLCACRDRLIPIGVVVYGYGDYGDCDDCV